MINKRCLVIRGNEWQLGYMMATLERIFKTVKIVERKNNEVAISIKSNMNTFDELRLLKALHKEPIDYYIGELKD